MIIFAKIATPKPCHRLLQTMRKSVITASLASLLLSPTAWADEQATPPDNASNLRNWHFTANISYTTRTLDGSVVSRTPAINDAFGDLVATGDSMNLDTSDALMYTLIAHYKKWHFGLNYAPTSFSGQGYAIVDLSGTTTGVLAKTPLNTTIDIDLLLGKISYDLIQTSETRFGVGVGLGSSYINLNIIPQVGNAIIYNGNQPFGFLSLYMLNEYNQFLYGFNVNGISASFEGVQVDYSDYTVELGYRLSDKDVKWDIIWGYRLVNFSIDLESGQNVYKATTKLDGPFIGVSVTY